MAERSRYFYEDVELSEDMKVNFTVELAPTLMMVRDKLQALPEWTKEAIHDVLNSTAEAQGLKLGKFAPLVRIAMTGGTVSPSIDLTIFLVGKDRAVKRLNQALASVEE